MSLAVATVLTQTYHLILIVLIAVTCTLVQHPDDDAWKIVLLFFAGMATTVFIAKRCTQVTRPDGSDHLSFPSGHAASATFAAAVLIGALILLRRPSVGTKTKIIIVTLSSIGLISWAISIGWSRVFLKRHYICDVIVGTVTGLAFAAACTMAWFLQAERHHAYKKQARDVGHKL
jgi:membrane-associated phospholipid phosphatase